MPKFLNLYSIATLLFLFIGVCLLITLGDKAIVIGINSTHTPTWDRINVLLSEYGRGEHILFTFLILLIIPSLRNKLFIKYASLYGIAAIGVSYLAKHILHTPRPLSVYRRDLYAVDWTDNAFDYSLPSGHTLAAFSFFAFILYAFLPNAKFVQVFFFLCALAIGISRIYLAQHFLSDVLLGAIMGLLIGYLTGAFYRKKSGLNTTIAQSQQ